MGDSASRSSSSVFLRPVRIRARAGVHKQGRTLGPYIVSIRTDCRTASIYMQAWNTGSQLFDAFRGHAEATTVLHGGMIQLSCDHDAPCGRQKGSHGTHMTMRSG
jgi:hypothetical protein